MRRFRQFIAENPIVIESGPAYIGGAGYSGPLNLPDLGLGAVYNNPGEAPPGGFSSFSQVVGSFVDKDRYGNVERYQTLQTLQKLGALANNVVILIQKNDPAQLKMTMRYRLAQFIHNRYIIGLPLKGMMMDGGYPEMRPQDIDIGSKLHIIIKDPHPPHPSVMQANGMDPSWEMYAIDTERLREVMEQHVEDSRDTERRYKAWNYLGGEADRAWGLMTQGGNYMKAVNPLSGS